MDRIFTYAWPITSRTPPTRLYAWPLVRCQPLRLYSLRASLALLGPAHGAPTKRYSACSTKWRCTPHRRSSSPRPRTRISFQRDGLRSPRYKNFQPHAPKGLKKQTCDEVCWLTGHQYPQLELAIEAGENPPQRSLLRLKRNLVPETIDFYSASFLKAIGIRPSMFYRDFGHRPYAWLEFAPGNEMIRRPLQIWRPRQGRYTARKSAIYPA